MWCCTWQVPRLFDFKYCIVVCFVLLSISLPTAGYAAAAEGPDMDTEDLRSGGARGRLLEHKRTAEVYTNVYM